MLKYSSIFSHNFFLILIGFIIILAPDTCLPAIVSVRAIPASGVAPLEVELICNVSTATGQPSTYTIDYGDGTEEIVDSNLYSHTFKHTYDGGFYKARCSVEKDSIGTQSKSDPVEIIIARWKFETGDDIDTSPAIAPDGTIYVGSDDSNLYAIDPETGTEIWRFTAGGEIRSSPAVAPDGTIYFGSSDNYLYALQPNGTMKWAFNIGDYIFSSPAIGPDGRTIYVGSSDHNLYAINTTGTLKWKYETDGKIISSPAIGFDGIENVIYFGSLDHYVYALATSNGQLKWKFKGTAGFYSSPAIGANGQIYIGECETGEAKEYKFNLYCLNLDGSMSWNYNGGTGFYSSPAIDPDGNIYVGSWDGYLFSLSSHGIFRWSIRPSPPADINSSPAIGSNGVIYVGSKGGNFYAFQSQEVDEDFREDWIFKTNDDILESSPVIDSDGTIYFGSRDNCLYAINPGNLNLADSPWPMFNKSPDHSSLSQDIEVPSIISTDPIDGTTNVEKNLSEIKVNFSPNFKDSQIDVDSYSLKKGDEEIDGYAVLNFVRYNNSSYNLSAVFTRFNDDEPLDYNTEYVASISYYSDQKDENTNNKEEEIYSWSFKTEKEPVKDPDPSPKGDFSCFINTIR